MEPTYKILIVWSKDHSAGVYELYASGEKQYYRVIEVLEEKLPYGFKAIGLGEMDA